MRFIRFLISRLLRQPWGEEPAPKPETVSTYGRISVEFRESGETPSNAARRYDLEGERERMRRQLLESSTKFRIRLHISQMDGDGSENDLGPWPEHVAQVSNLEGAMDLCTLLSHHIPSFLFPRERAS